MRKTRVYVAGPYSSDPAMGTRNAILVGSQLLDAGYSPYIPHLTHFWHLITPKNYETWMTLDFEWLALCDVMFRLPGMSSGAEREAAFAQKHGILVYKDLAALMRYTPTEQPEVAVQVEKL